MRRIAVRSVLVAAFALAPHATSAQAASAPTQIDFSVCPQITTVMHYPVPAEGPSGCGPFVVSPEAISISPDNSTCGPVGPRTDLGTFLTSQNPFGVFVHVSGANTCATSPPTRGPGMRNGAGLTVSVAQIGFCPTTLTIPAPAGSYDRVAFPVGTLPLGTYRVTATFPDQTTVNPESQQSTTWIGSQATGTLHVGTTFVETDTSVLARPGASETLAVLARNSAAGPGAGELVSTRTGNPSVRTVTGTEYFACGTISVAATVTYGRPARNGVARLIGNGRITRGTGNYVGLRGTFTLSGRYSAKTSRATFVLRGTATYEGGSSFVAAVQEDDRSIEGGPADWLSVPAPALPRIPGALSPHPLRALLEGRLGRAPPPG